MYIYNDIMPFFKNVFSLIIYITASLKKTY